DGIDEDEDAFRQSIAAPAVARAFGPSAAFLREGGRYFLRSVRRLPYDWLSASGMVAAHTANGAGVRHIHARQTTVPAKSARIPVGAASHSFEVTRVMAESISARISRLPLGSRKVSAGSAAGDALAQCAIGPFIGKDAFSLTIPEAAPNPGARSAWCGSRSL
ncbi:MAG: hypothetical protein KGK12_15590, partial [Armatimonadetes bacterium]|nr:hypothetical protein [Armatimonadota bacterium]